jgi:CRP-like cAMP-binding protein
LKVPFFRDGDNAFIQQVVLALQVNHFLAGDTVIEIGSTGDEMYFISSGICEVITDNVVRARLSSGAFFGGISLNLN